MDSASHIRISKLSEEAGKLLSVHVVASNISGLYFLPSV